MSTSAPDPETLLFTDRDGERGQLQDIIDDGLDGGYEHRVPQLIDLLAQGEDEHQLWACVTLVSWGHETGFDTLIAWADDPASVPWTSGRGFGDLADAVRTSFYCEPSPQLLEWRRNAVLALLRVADRQPVSPGLALVLSRDEALAAAAEGELRAAIARALDRLSGDAPVDSGLANQVASLLMPLARLDDLAAATYADRLLEVKPRGQRVLRELADALGQGTGPATLNSLERLASRGIGDHVERVLERRQRAGGASS